LGIVVSLLLLSIPTLLLSTMPSIPVFRRRRRPAGYRYSPRDAGTDARRCDHASKSISQPAATDLRTGDHRAHRPRDDL
jgi:hypothetical protein